MTDSERELATECPNCGTEFHHDGSSACGCETWASSIRFQARKQERERLLALAQHLYADGNLDPTRLRLAAEVVIRQGPFSVQTTRDDNGNMHVTVTQPVSFDSEGGSDE